MDAQVRSNTQNAAILLHPDHSRLVLLCGPIARQHEPANGGFQSANLRVSHVLESVGLKVKHLHYPDSDASAVRKALDYATAFLKIYATLLISRRAILHATPLCRHFIGLELGAFILARLFGHGIVCDIRAGNQQQEYDRRSALYRWMFRSVIKLADVISLENEQYLPFIDSITKDRVTYVMPNFVPRDIVKCRTYTSGPLGPRLAFVGRVNDAKGIPQTLMLHKFLREIIPGTRLAIMGAGEKKYVADLIDETRDDDSIQILGPLEPDMIFQELDKSHYFVLLSAHSGEGHSNALTEAMARGCVPITTKQGFLETVVGTTGFTCADRSDLRDIAYAIAENWQADQWRELSRRATHRVEARYTDSAVKDVILGIYNNFEVQRQAT
jgi:glycosyltransferase involved in cell wall biosynthesis